MTTLVLDLKDKRTDKAMDIAATADSWLKVRTPQGKAYGIRSSRDPQQVYLVTARTCTCEDAARHPGSFCKHVRAVRLHVALVKGIPVEVAGIAA
jgi:hypothetical protein